MNSDSILLVDDEELVLSSYQRVLRKQFQFDVATGGAEALAKIEAGASYAVVVSDMRMPGMNGIELLRRLKSQSPDSVRLMLTGNSDVQTAIDAVNEGSVFRFLTKPCTPEALGRAIADGVRQYRLVRAERDLLEQTLQGSIRVLTEVLSLTNPAVFNRALRIREYVQVIVRHLELADAWQYEVAALLSNLGAIVSSKEDERQFIENPEIAERLLARIPRLERVAEMIGQLGSLPRDPSKRLIGTEILRVCGDFHLLILNDLTPQAAVKHLREDSLANYSATVLDALGNVAGELFEHLAMTVEVANLTEQMVFDADLYTISGTLLVSRGTPITGSLLIRLRSFRDRRILPKDIRVLVHQPRFSGKRSEL